MNLPMVTLLAPPNFFYQCLNIMAQTQWNLEAPHGIGGDSLNYRFNQDFSSLLAVDAPGFSPVVVHWVLGDVTRL